jgi:hypothetical protein
MAIRAVALGLLFSLGIAAGAAAQPPGPTATPGAAIFGGSVWVNAQRVADRDVTAKIGDTVCATNRAPLVTPPGAGAPTWGLAVPPEQALPGCGREGALVTFFVGDEQAAQVVEWHAGEDLRVDLIVGAPFAYFEFTGVTAQVEQMIWTGSAKIVPLVGGKPCGYGNVVYSDEQEAGCGVEGSRVTFELVDAEGNVVAVAEEKGVWHAWDGISFQWFNLTFGPAGVITMPGTGTGDESNAGAQRRLRWRSRAWRASRADWRSAGGRRRVSSRSLRDARRCRYADRTDRPGGICLRRFGCFRQRSQHPNVSCHGCHGSSCCCHRRSV